MDPPSMDLYEAQLQLTLINNNNPKTKKKIIKNNNKSENYHPKYARIRFVTLKKSQIN